MQDQSSTVCFACGQAVGFPARINHRSDGSVCQPCADRALGSIPPALPRTVEAEQEAEDIEAELERVYAPLERPAESAPETDDAPPDVPA